MKQTLTFIAALAIMFGVTYGVQRSERETAEHKVCVVRQKATVLSNERAQALKDVAQATIEASENGAVVPGYVVPKSVKELKKDNIPLLPVPKC